MFEDEYNLTLDEENEIEQPANIYSMIRTLDFIVSLCLFILLGMGV